MTRTQIYLEEPQHRLLQRRAKAVGVTKSAIIRRAIDSYLGLADEEEPVRRFREALADAAGSVSRLPTGRDYVHALRKHDMERHRRLERRR